ncbi:hypothetical protein RJT34_14828 [Clitoria ternatea]|uniref:NIF system FeS cluster assembly NifU C-terminal domain-containing protein n=1 Tax=Clitoria ternatea TaxID=43366 RepID=A0AAN9JR48_CLITE
MVAPNLPFAKGVGTYKVTQGLDCDSEIGKQRARIYEFDCIVLLFLGGICLVQTSESDKSKGRVLSGYLELEMTFVANKGYHINIKHFSRLISGRAPRNKAGIVSPSCILPLTEENVERVLDEVRPGLMADGGNVALHEIDGLVVILKLQGACGSCPSSTMTLKMGIETRLRDKIPEIIAVGQILYTETGLELTEENVESVWNFIHHF